jgi:hypothetical protein
MPADDNRERIETIEAQVQSLAMALAQALSRISVLESRLEGRDGGGK